MLSSNVTARLKFDYEFKLIEPGKYDLTNVKLDNIYYNDYNLIIFNKETVNGDKVNYYYEFIRDNSNSFILLKKVKLDFDYKNIYIHEDNTNQEGILKIYLYGMNRTMMSLFIKLDNIKLNIKDKDNNPKSNLEYRGITKVYNKKESKYTRKQLYYPNNNITTIDYKGMN